jgi:predicted RNase H-like HicB family nuclease
MRQKRRYDIKIDQREDGWFAVSVPDLPEVQTQTFDRNDVEFLARHAIGQWLEVSPDSIAVKVVR